jgi:hypothetical protein
MFLEVVILKTIIVEGITYKVTNANSILTVDYTYYLLSIQSWIFAIKYLESALNCSLSTRCLTQRVINVSLWTGIGIYFTSHTVCFIFLIVTFPGYVNDNSFAELESWTQEYAIPI